MHQFINNGPAGLANGTVITGSNTANPDGYATPVVAAGGAVVADTAITFKGQPSYKITTPATGAVYLPTPGIFVTGDSPGLAEVRTYFSFPTLPASAQGILSIRSNTAGTGLASFLLNSDGSLNVTNDAPAPNGGASAHTTGLLTATTKYYWEYQLDTNAGGGAGTITVNLRKESDDTLVASTTISMTAQTFPTSNPGMIRVGRTSGNGVWQINIGPVDFKAGSTALAGPYVSASSPVAAFTVTPNGMSVDLDASGSTAPGSSITAYAWDFGDGTTGGGTPKTHPYAAPGVYTIGLTITAANALTSTITHTYDARLPVDVGHAYEIITSTGYTNVGGAADLLTAITNGSDADYAATPVNPTSANSILLALPQMNTPAAGEDGIFHIRTKREAASASGSWVAKLYDDPAGAGSPFHTTSAFTVPSGASFVTYDAVVPAADLATVDPTSWGKGGAITVRLEPTAA